MEKPSKLLTSLACLSALAACGADPASNAEDAQADGEVSEIGPELDAVPDLDATDATGEDSPASDVTEIGPSDLGEVELGEVDDVETEIGADTELEPDELCTDPAIVCRVFGSAEDSDSLEFSTADVVSCRLTGVDAPVRWTPVLSPPQLVTLTNDDPDEDTRWLSLGANRIDGNRIDTDAVEQLVLWAQHPGRVQIEAMVISDSTCVASAELSFASPHDYEFIMSWQAEVADEWNREPDVDLHVLTDGGCWNSSGFDCNYSYEECSFENGAEATRTSDHVGYSGSEVVWASSYAGDYRLGCALLSCRHSGRRHSGGSHLRRRKLAFFCADCARDRRSDQRGLGGCCEHASRLK